MRAILTLASALKCNSVDEAVEDWFWPERPLPPDPDWLHRHGHHDI